MPIIYIFKDKYLDLPPFWWHNACEIKIRLSQKPSSATLKFHVKEFGFFDFFGTKYTYDYTDALKSWVDVNGQTLIDTGDSIKVCNVYSATGVEAYLNAPYEDVFTVHLATISGVVGARHYIIFDLYLEIPEGEPAPEKIVVYETSGTGQSIDNIFTNIYQFIQLVLFIIPLVLILNLITTIMPRK